MSHIHRRSAVTSHAFVSLPVALALRQARRPLQQASPHVFKLTPICSLLKTTTKASLVTKTSRNDRVLAQGPFCRFVDPQILRHCVTCAKKSKRAFTEPDACVMKLLQEARSSLKKAERGKAELFFLRAIAVDPSQSKSYFLYALQVQRRDPQLARELFSLGTRENPHDAKLLQAWGLFESKQGHMKRAQRLLRRSVFLEPKHAPVLRWKRIFSIPASKKQPLSA